MSPEAEQAFTTSRLERHYLALLNGPTGRLDCGSLDGEVRHWARKFGFTDEEADQL